MNKTLTSIATLCLLASTAVAQEASMFNHGWQFSQGDDTSRWQNVTLPHDWSILTPPDRDAPSGNDGGYYATGIGWYKKTLHIGKLADGERISLDFEGVYQKATVYVNGRQAAWHGYGYTPFSVDITDYATQNAHNTVTVRVDNSEQKNCRWYSGSGIYRNVWLRRTRSVNVPAESVDFHTSDDGTVIVTGTIMNNASQHRTARLVVSIEDAHAEKTMELAAKSGMDFKLELKVAEPQPWSFDSPTLYLANVIVDGDINLMRKIGFRTITYSATDGFMLNGQKVLINGACVHHDNGLLGAASPDAAEYHKVKMMKAAGFNLIRTSHNPPSEAFLDACDNIGMMVIDEAFDGWRTPKTDHDYAELFDSLAVDDIQKMVTRDRHHPSIIAWSIGNEVIERKDIRVIHTAKMLKKAITDIDDTRPVTEALCSWDSDWEIYDPHADVLDIVGYNYMIFKHKTDHERAPGRIIWQTESYPNDAYQNHEIVKNNPYVIGDIVWTGLDYLGESGIGGWRYQSWPQGEHWENAQWPWHGAYCGDVDITGHRKPISYYRDIIWNGSRAAEPLHIAVREPDGYTEPIKTTLWSTWPTWDSWNWPGWENKPIDIEVYATGKTVRLYQDDKLVGERPVTNNMATFTTEYRPGTLRAECDGKSVTLKTAAAPAKITLAADRKRYSPDGNDVAFIDMTITDKDGVPCAMSSDELTIKVKGGELLAFGTADLRDNSDIHDLSHKAYHGRAQAIVRIPIGNKPVTVSVKGNGIAAATVKLR